MVHAHECAPVFNTRTFKSLTKNKTGTLSPTIAKGLRCRARALQRKPFAMVGDRVPVLFLVRLLNVRVLKTGAHSCACTMRSEEHTSELQSPAHLLCRPLP